MTVYAQYLSSVQKKAEIFATDDICNAQGQLIVKKGVILSGAMMDRIVCFKLMRPVEDCVAIAKELDDKRLLAIFRKFIKSEDFYHELHRQIGVDDLLKDSCEALAVFPLLRQKLTVLAYELPRTFHQALFCAWWSLVICRRLDYKELECHSAFIAAMTHDIGFLHIDPEIFNKNSRLSLEEVKQIHAHPIIGQKILSGIQGLLPLVSEAVLQHHESLDGAGYPKSMSTGPYNKVGRLLFLLDNIYGVYNSVLKQAGCSLIAVLPVIQMHYHLRNSPEFGAFRLTINQSTVPHKNNLNDEYISDIVGKVSNGRAYVKRFLAVRDEVIRVFNGKNNDQRLKAIQLAYSQVHSMMMESGLLDDQFICWLEEVETDHLVENYSDAQDSFFMIKEIVYQIRQIKNRAQVFFDDTRNADLLIKIPDILSKIGMEDDPGF